jgi:hypothetical protein
MHARATIETNQLYRALFNKAREAMGPGAEKACRNCHYPSWTAAALEAGAPVEGVACVSCHRIPAGHPKARLEDGRASALVAAGTEPGLDGAEGLCLTCHGELSNPQGHPVCTTAAELAPGGRTCVDCHMPARDGKQKPRDGKRSHRFPGAYDREFVAGAAAMEAVIVMEEGAPVLQARITNRGAGHSLPTGNPMRSVRVRAQAMDKDGKVIWQNFTDNPLAQDPGAVFQRVFRDAQGKGPVPPFMASGPSTDSRLVSDKTRVLTWKLDERARSARVVLEFSLGPDGMLKAAGLPPEVARPVVMREITVMVPDGRSDR